MTRDEAKERFNALPRETRTTIIGHEITLEIGILERERNSAIASHAANLRRINDRIKTLNKSLENLKDD